MNRVYHATGSSLWVGASFVSLSSGSESKSTGATTSPTTPVSTSATTTETASTPIQSSTGVASTTDWPLSVTTSPTPSASPVKQTGISKGAAAGIGIGCLLAGVLITGLLAWLCLGKRRSKPRPGDQEGSAMAFLHREKGPVVNAHSVSSGNTLAAAIDNGLPQPLEDKAITGEVNKLENLIKNHVQSFYHTSRVSPGLLDSDDLQRLGTSLPISIGTLSTLLDNSTTREIALRFCIAWVLTSRIELRDNATATFLPPEAFHSFQSMYSADQDSRVKSLRLAKWRAITAELMQPKYGQSSFTSSDPRTESIAEALDVLDAILRPYADSRMNSAERRRNLEEMLKRAASFAFTLFAQPSSWIFDWQEEQGVRSGSLCIFPALLQASDETGEPVRPPRKLSEAVVRKLDG
ncbi:hypothetical protein EJ04DRAFT_449432 [Polyplosphaeria fusca]|uniref:Uncharacterized protein n=1 Tax=Polyplosphaeria fusca TaxID=682080 RepID=A0A9P4UU06_9PLEO|nr:hypothetical protein EJ04DRAFT_449432 [Polyplosphaeria fusca]